MALPYFYKWESLETMFNRYLFNCHLLKVCLAAVFVIGLTACSSDNNPASTDTGMEQTSDERELAALREQIAGLQAQLELDADDNIGDSITALQNEVIRLEGLIQVAEDAEETERRQEAMRKASAMLTALRNSELAFESNLAPDKQNDGMLRSQPTGDRAATSLRPTATSAMARNGLTPEAYGPSMPANGTEDRAFVYSTQGDPIQQPFDVKYASALTDGALPDNYLGTNPGLIDGPDFAVSSSGMTHHQFDEDAHTLRIPGTFDGAQGTYSCSQTDGGADFVCTSGRSNNGGYVLSGTSVTWKFEPADEAITSTPNPNYVTFGWWLRRTSASYGWSTFVDTTGTVSEPTAQLVGLNGTATYHGAVAGLYALSDPLSGLSDAGEFSADATLTADWAGVTGSAPSGFLTGVFDNFTGHDGESRDWTVNLGMLPINNTGEIQLEMAATTWVIGDQAAEASGKVNGQLYQPATAADRNGAFVGVPLIATGTFESEYGNVGAMRGAFGANLD